jgi:hypothetical protein
MIRMKNPVFKESSTKITKDTESDRDCESILFRRLTTEGTEDAEILIG